jgi:TonB family protein
VTNVTETMIGTLVLFLLGGLASAQTGEDARALLQEVASTSLAAKSWLAEGVRASELTGRGMSMHSETRFKSAYQNPSKTLSETTGTETISGRDSGAPGGGLRVCDGTDLWIHNIPSESFYRSPVSTGGCRPELGDFSKLSENLVSATRIGIDHVQSGGETRECVLVRAEYSVPRGAGNNAAPPNFVRRLCIDLVEKIVLRDQVEHGNSSDVRMVETTTYEVFKRDTELPADLFQFQVPTGYFEDDGPQPDLIEENGVYRKSAQIGGPELLSKIEPQYTAEALESGISGVVIVSFQVGSDGIPAKMKVVRGLGHGLDQAAVEAVGKWRFRAAIKDGEPVAVGPLKVAVSFRRP